MKEWGMHPVLPGYSGMIPSKLDLGNRIDGGKEEKTLSNTSSESAQSTLNKDVYKRQDMHTPYTYPTSDFRLS